MSLPLPGAWIEMGVLVGETVDQLSLPLPGAWIEMVMRSLTALQSSRSLYRERGLKYNPCELPNLSMSRSLYRERGLKCQTA